MFQSSGCSSHLFVETLSSGMRRRIQSAPHRAWIDEYKFLRGNDVIVHDGSFVFADPDKLENKMQERAYYLFHYLAGYVTEPCAMQSYLEAARSIESAIGGVCRISGKCIFSIGRQTQSQLNLQLQEPSPFDADTTYTRLVTEVAAPVAFATATKPLQEIEDATTQDEWDAAVEHMQTTKSTAISFPTSTRPILGQFYWKYKPNNPVPDFVEYVDESEGDTNVTPATSGGRITYF